jgi:shikimate dehydrogenase
VTIPFKTDIIRYLDTLDPSAGSLQSVNSIQILHGSLTGYNTDQFGFSAMLTSTKISPGARALILGAGGASRAVIASLLDAGIQVTICCRNETQYAESVALCFEKKSSVSYHRWSESIDSDGFQVVVNTTPLGGANNASAPCPLPFENTTGIYFDLNYNAENRWLAAARLAGWETYDGSRMLIWQAIRSFEIWTGRKVEFQVIYQRVFGRP